MGKEKRGAKDRETAIKTLEGKLKRNEIAEAKKLAETEPDVVRLAMKYIASKKSLGAKQEALIKALEAKDAGKAALLRDLLQEAKGLKG